MRHYTDNYIAQLTAPVTAGDSSLQVDNPPVLPAGKYMVVTLTDSNDPSVAPTKLEIVTITSVSSNTLTLEAGTVNSWAIDDYVDERLTASSLLLLDGPELLRYREKTGTASSGAITTAAGPVQDIDLTVLGNTTLSFPDLQDGQNVTLHVLGLDSGWTLAFPAGAKTPEFPDLSAAVEAVFQVWKKGAQIYVSSPQVYS
ncbi:hypothetical protein [Marinobacterium stanieri]|uniref:hypothetical protein n=1 Tax=Marinobacterium stanieri TaxID=49186 RepID=UPI000255A8A8|nr:hypothetical protein [Marinobacterium stanieri]